MGLEAYIVGGAVRDMVLGLTPKDFDIEVYGVNYDNLIDRISHLGKLDLVGKSFGVLKLKTDDAEFDLTLPRLENRVGVGHTDFQVTFDESIRLIDACRRRDFTMNSMAMGMNGNIIDFFGGKEHLERQMLVPTSNAFKEDALRVLRGMQFASRFNMLASPRLIEYAKEMFDDYQYLSVDRVRDEWLKWAKGRYPHRGIQLLRECAWLIHYPEIYDMWAVEQNPRHHAEGNVLKHTEMVLSYAGLQENPIITFSALCHDMGKVTHTIVEDGEIKSPGHNDPTLAIEFCNRISLPLDMTARVASLVREHMFQANEVTPRTIRRLLTRLATPNDFELLCQIMTADRLGRTPRKLNDITEINQMRVIYRELGADNAIKPIIMGRHLINAGFTPSPLFSKALSAAFEAQLDGEYDFDKLLKIATIIFN